VDPRLLRALVSEDPRASDTQTATYPQDQVLAHFRAVIADAWRSPSDETRAAKRRLDYFCGHIDATPRLRDFIPVSEVAAHYTALNGPAVQTGVSFGKALGMYLSLLNADLRNGAHGDEFRGASVALTFDGARHEANMLRFVDDGNILTRVLTPERPGKSR
jgi:hypothetical protein